MGDSEKELFRDLFRRCETFYGIRVVTYCVMSNHFHLLLEVPEPHPISETEALERIAALYSRKDANKVKARLETFRAQGLHELARKLMESYTRRMFSLSNFMKSLKQRFSAHFNRTAGRKGTLWEERFKSIIVQGEERTLAIMALYIDLNPVRAGLVTDPASYPYCGFAEAVAGGHIARWGITRVAPARRELWSFVEANYRILLAEMTEKGSASAQPWSTGWILGSREFVREWQDRNRWRFGNRSHLAPQVVTPLLDLLPCVVADPTSALRQKPL